MRCSSLCFLGANKGKGERRYGLLGVAAPLERSFVSLLLLDPSRLQAAHLLQSPLNPAQAAFISSGLPPRRSRTVMIAFKLLLLLSASTAFASGSHSPRNGFIKQRRSHALAGRALGDLVGAVDSAAAAATTVVGEAVTGLSGVGKQLKENLTSIVAVKAAVEATTTSESLDRPLPAQLLGPVADPSFFTATSSSVSVPTAVEISTSSTSSVAPTSSVVPPTTTSAVALTTTEDLTPSETSTTSLLEPAQSTQSTESSTLLTATLTDSIVTRTPSSLPASLRTVAAASRSSTRSTSTSSSPTAASLAAEPKKTSAMKVTFVTLGIIGGGILALLIAFTLLRKFVFAKKSEKFDDRLVPPALWPTAAGDRRSWESFESRGMSAVGGGASFAPTSSGGGRSVGAEVGSSFGSIRSEGRSQAGRGYGSIRREGGNA